MAEQAGVLSRRQAVAAGMSLAAWEHRFTSGRWQRPVAGVAIGHSGQPTARQHAWAAVLHAGAGATLSGDAALRVLDLKGTSPSRIDVVVTPPRCPGNVRFPGGPVVVVHRMVLPEGVRRARLGLPYVDPSLAALHAAAWAPSDRAAAWRLAAVVQQQLTVPALLRPRLLAAVRLPRRAQLVRVLDDVELGAHAGTELEFLRFCRRHRLPLPDELQLRVPAGGTRYLDARYRRQRISIELDGAHHREVGQWEADALRTLEVAAAMPGERVVRLTPGLLHHDGDRVAALLRTLLT